MRDNAPKTSQIYPTLELASVHVPVAHDHHRSPHRGQWLEHPTGIWVANKYLV